jgi:energy-coupling factor transporter ATP-binding protein EcfA2
VPNLDLVSEELRRAVAIAVRDARSHAEVIDLAQQYAEPIEPSDEPVLSCDEFDRLLDPLTPTEERFRLFQRFLHDAVAFDRIDGLTPAHLANDSWVQHLFDETLSWGEAGRLLLADERLWQLTVYGAAGRVSGYGSEVIQPTPYASSRVPLSRAEFLVLATGGSWNRQTPLTSITFRSGTRIKLAREPLVRTLVPGQPGFLCIVQRGETVPWTLKNLIEQQVLDGSTAALLTALLHARCSLLISGPPGSGKSALLEALLHTVPTDQSLVVLGSPSGAKPVSDGQRQQDVNLDTGVLPEKLGAFLATFGSGLVADRFVAAVTDPTSADVAMTMLKVGVPVLLTIDAVTPSASFDRLTQSLSGPNLGMCQGFIGTVLEREHDIHVHVHLAQPGWGRLGYVSEVHVLADVAKRPVPALVTVATVDTTPTERTWTHSALINDRALRFENQDHTVPASLRTRLADVPEEIWEQWRSEPLERPAAGSFDPALRPYRRLLHDARALFEAGDFAAAAKRLEAASALNGGRSLEDLADDLLASGTCAPLERYITQRAAAITAALDAGEADKALALLRDRANVLAERSFLRGPDWPALALRVEAMRELNERWEDELASVEDAKRRGDIRGAYTIVSAMRTDLLLPEAKYAVLATRHELLKQLIAQLEEAAEEHDTYVAELSEIAHELTTGQRHVTEASGATENWDGGATLTYPQTPDASLNPHTPQAAEQVADAHGWLDAALARNRERWHRQPSEQDVRGE